MRYRNPSRGAASVVVIGVDGGGMGLIRECLGTEAVLPTQSTPYADALQVVRKTRPNVVLMGFDGDFDAAIALGPRLTAEIANVHMVAISERTDPDRIRAAMRAGYREYVVLPDDSPLLRQAVHDAAYGTEQSEDQGEVIALVGSKGGCGATSLAVNLAAELSAMHRVLVLDLDFSMGDVAAFLDLKPASSIQDVLENMHRMDARMLRGSVTVHPPSKLHILAQPADLVPPSDVRQEDIIRVLSVAAEAYQYVLVDCGSRVDTATLTATSIADRVMLVSTPTVPSIKNAWRRLQLMTRQGIEADGLRLVINQWEKGAEIHDADIEANLKVPIAARIRRDDATCRKAAALGQLTRELDRRAGVNEDISAAVSLITEGVAQVEVRESKKAFGWLFSR